MTTLLTPDPAPDATPDGPPPSPELLRRYPSLRADGQFGPLQRRPTPPPAPPDTSDPRWQAHQEAVAVERREALRLRNRYPTMDERSQMPPIPPDPALLKRYPSMPGGGVDLPETPLTAKPTPAPAQPTQPTAVSSEPVATEPRPAPTELPSPYVGMALPENLTLDPDAFGSAAARMHEVGLDRQQAEAMTALHGELMEREAEGFKTQQAQWRNEVERELTPEMRQSISVAMRSAPRELRDLLDRSGFGDNPFFVRFVADLGRRLGTIADPHLARYPSMKDWR